MEKLSASQVTKLLREFEDIVLELDKAIESKEVGHEAFSDLRARYDTARDAIVHSNGHNDSRYYIIDEAAGLLAWIENEKTTAYGKISDAVARKGDKSLTSHAGSGLAATIKYEASGMKSKTEKYDSGLLGFMYGTVLLVMIGSVPMAMLLTAGMISMMASGVVKDLPSMLPHVILFCTFAVLSTYYVVRASRHARRMIAVATMLFVTLSLYCIYLILVIETTATSDWGSTAPYNATLLMLMLCGIATVVYYSKAAKVRRVFNQ